MIHGSAARRLLPALAAAAGFLFAGTARALPLHVDRLDASDTYTLSEIMQALEPVIAAKKADGSAIIMSWEALYAPLSIPQRKFLDLFRHLKAADLGATSHYFGEAPPEDLEPVGLQQITRQGQPETLPPQYLPRPVLEAYRRMMAAMQAAIGRELMVDSGYRAPAYQLYLFLFYMPKHGRSITETNKFVALPGHSEHGYPPRQAVDFVSLEGVDGDGDPEAFEALPEYAWLQAHAREFGFVLSYPRGNALNTSFEPWHWHYEGAREKGKETREEIPND